MFRTMGSREYIIRAIIAGVGPTPRMPISLRKGKAKDSAESGAMSSPNSARLGIVWVMLAMKNIGF